MIINVLVILKTVKKFNPFKFIKRIASGFVNLIKGIRDFIFGAFGELKKVVWLKRKDAIKFTVYVSVFLLASSLFIAMLDIGFFRIVKYITAI